MRTLLLTFTLVSVMAFGQNDKDLAEQSVNQAIIKSHIGFLASDEMRGRDTGSPELKIAAQYLKSRFVEYDVEMAPGMETYFQKVPMKKTTPPTSGTLGIGDDTYLIKDDFLMIDGENVDVNAGAVFVEYGSEEDLKKEKN